MNGFITESVGKISDGLFAAIKLVLGYYLIRLLLVLVELFFGMTGVVIFVFILSGQFAGVGFLVAAKSIFRFGELKDSENRKQAEYVIIGTFTSFLLAILISLAAQALLRLPAV